METTLTTCKNNSFSRRATARRFHNRAQLCAEEQEVVSTVVHVVFKNLSSFTFPCEARTAGYTADRHSVYSVYSVVDNAASVFFTHVCLETTRTTGKNKFKRCAGNSPASQKQVVFNKLFPIFIKNRTLRPI